MSSEPLLEVRGLSAAWAGREVVSDVTLSAAAGEFVVLMGPNGSGKSTLLRTIAGFERPVRGRVLLQGRDVTDVPPHRRGIGLLFQESALFPGRSVWQNIAYGLQVARRPDAEVDRRVRELVELLHLEGLEERAPEALSGGERQRVALARTLAPRPGLVLLDEPFASVDPELRTELRAEFRTVLHRTGTAVVHVTHDRDEGLFLGDRVLLLFDGRLAQDGPPGSVYLRPSTARAARFLGYNVVEVEGRAMAVDPREIELGPPDHGRSAVVEAAGPTPEGFAAVLRLTDGGRLEVRSPDRAASPPVGRTVGVRWTRAVALGSGPVR